MKDILVCILLIVAILLVLLLCCALFLFLVDDTNIGEAIADRIRGRMENE